ncbi:CCA tRNA nucleotidyltransferase [Patescibacteria group bacterium]|nr:CCA tRNA nucleotidyltransferase [Patescibacteria group bacterium]
MKIPREIEQISQILATNGFKAYLVGGCVRDLLLDIQPKDWDLTTDAKPDKLQELFPDSVYENDFGTVGVKTDSGDSTLKIVEITTFRKEGKYTDKRHPDEVVFADTVEEDLSRRDFTINAIAIGMGDDDKVVDPFGGQKDLENKLIKAVGDAKERFDEDALRIMRAVRLSAQLGLEIEKKTADAISDKAKLLKNIASERIRDELEKLLMTERAGDGIRKMEELGLLKEVLPELSEGVGVEQNKHHIYDVFEHNVRSLEYSVSKDFSCELRLASLLHDVGKVGTREWKNDSKGDKAKGNKKGDWTFYQHQYLGEKITRDIMNRLKFPKEMIKKVTLLVREHMFVYDPEVVTEKGVRRLLHRVGEENADDLIKVREADRIGSGVPKAQPYRLRHLQAMIEKAKGEPVSVKQLKIDGGVLIKEVGMEPGPKMGYVLAILLEEVLDEPKLNIKKELLEKARKLSSLSEKNLKKMADKARKTAVEEQKRLDDAIKGKYFVK